MRIPNCRFATGPQMKAMSRIIRDGEVHYSWIHHSTRLSLIKHGYVTEDKDGYLHLTEMSRIAIG